MSKLILKEDEDFTPTALKNYLNEVFGGKASGKGFNLSDIQQYEIRGYLPKKYGGCLIKIVQNKKIGVKVLRLHSCKEQTI